MSKSTQDAILVTGATGNVGRNVVTQLLEHGHPLRALTRNPEAAGLPDQVQLVRGDLSIPSTLEKALEGVDAVFLVWRSFPAAIVPELIDLMAKHARRIVFLSSSAVRDDLKIQTNPIGKIHAEIEDVIQKSGLEWTFLRPGSFAANTLAWWGPQIRAGDVVRWPYATAAWAPIHERDIAAVAARALTENGHGGAKYFLTGSECLTQIEQLRTIAEAIKRSLRFEELSPDVARTEMSAFMPPFIVERLLQLWAGMVDVPVATTETVAQVTGARARTFREWATDHASNFQLAP